MLKLAVAGFAALALCACNKDADAQPPQQYPAGSYENPIVYTRYGDTFVGQGKYFCIDDFEYIYIDHAMTPVYDAHSPANGPKFCGNR